MQGASIYPISLLIERLVADHGPTVADFVARLGYRNLERGTRRLQSWIATGEGSYRIIGQISVVYPHVATELKLAIRATAAIKKVEHQTEWLERCESEKETFEPFVHCIGERIVPQPITTFGVTGGHPRWTTIKIPQRVLDLPRGEQLYALLPLMQQYAARFHGQVPFFGKLRGFMLVRLSDHFVFDRTGVLVGQVLEPFRPGIVEVRLR